MQIKALIKMLLVLGVAPTSALAGDYLHLKAGSIKLPAPQAPGAFQSLSIKTRYQLVQFESSITLEQQDVLKSLGVEILRYVPENAYIVRIKNASMKVALGKVSGVSGLADFLPEYRINEESLALSVFNATNDIRIHLRSFEGADQTSIRRELSLIPGLKVIDEDRGAYIVSVEARQARSLSHIEGLEWVDLFRDIQMMQMKMPTAEEPESFEEVTARSLSDLTGYETGTRIMNFKKAWKKGLRGRGQIVAVADTGLDTGNVQTMSRDFNGLVKPFIAGIHSETWGDPDGHGTHVAGSVVNSGESSRDAVRGGAYEASLIIESLYSEKYGSLTIGPDPTPLFEAAYLEGARIHSNSWGSIDEYGVYDDTARAVDEFMFNNQDMLILFSAGNEGVDANADGRIDKGSVTSPSTAKNTLTVGASENLVEEGGVQIKLGQAGSDEAGFRWPVSPLAEDTLSNNPDGLAAFSSRGPTRDGRMKPDVVAPGTNILSNCSQYEGASKMWGEFNEDFCFSGGTSMSTPLVAAAAAIVRENLVKYQGQKNPSAALVKAVLMHTATDMYPGQYGLIGKARGQEILKPGPNSNQGYGRVDVDKAVARSLGFVDEKIGLATGEEKEVQVPRGTRRITLVYTDAPGSTAASKSLVNNLDLRVETSNGRIFIANSTLNNSEQLIIPVGARITKLLVKGTSVPMGLSGRQPFSLVYSRL